MDSKVGNHDSKEKLLELNSRATMCKMCPRLSENIAQISSKIPKRFVNDLYWARPLPSFGDAKAKLLIIGLAPAAHGGNRTGRLFTGDSSGSWVVRALYETGFANISTSESRNDGLVLKDAYISTAVRCAPPKNSPTRPEIASCSQYLISELITLDRTVRVVVTLGKIAFDAYCKIMNLHRLTFGHNTRYDIRNGKTLLASYHP